MSALADFPSTETGIRVGEQLVGVKCRVARYCRYGAVSPETGTVSLRFANDIYTRVCICVRIEVFLPGSANVTVSRRIAVISCPRFAGRLLRRPGPHPLRASLPIAGPALHRQRR